MITFVHVVVFPLPCNPTNMMTFGLPLVGCHCFSPGSISWGGVGEGRGGRRGGGAGRGGGGRRGGGTGEGGEGRDGGGRRGEERGGAGREERGGAGEGGYHTALTHCGAGIVHQIM